MFLEKPLEYLWCDSYTDERRQYGDKHHRCKSHYEGRMLKEVFKLLLEVVNYLIHLSSSLASCTHSDTSSGGSFGMDTTFLICNT